MNGLKMDNNQRAQKKFETGTSNSEQTKENKHKARKNEGKNEETTFLFHFESLT